MPDMNKKSIEPCYYRVSIKGIITDEENRILLTEEHNHTWHLPGGGLEHGETIEQCLTREIMEEIGVNIVKISDQPPLIWTEILDHHDLDNPCFFLAYKIEIDSLEFKKSTESIGTKFFDEESLKEVDLHFAFEKIRDRLFK